jgi:hypothetical protein
MAAAAGAGESVTDAATRLANILEGFERLDTPLEAGVDLNAIRKATKMVAYLKDHMFIDGLITRIRNNESASRLYDFLSAYPGIPPNEITWETYIGGVRDIGPKIQHLVHDVIKPATPAFKDQYTTMKQFSDTDLQNIRTISNRMIQERIPADKELKDEYLTILRKYIIIRHINLISRDLTLQAGHIGGARRRTRRRSRRS